MGGQERRETRQPHAFLPLPHHGDAGAWRVSRPRQPVSIISLVPLVRCLRATHASSLTEPAPNRESRVSFAASQVVSASSLLECCYLWHLSGVGTR